MNANQEIEVRSDGGLIKTSPRALLEHFLPDAQPYQGSTRIFEGHVPGNPNKKCYVQVEAMMGMLMEAREKRINPISGMYLIPSNGPDKPATHKIKYTEGIQRARLIPGFLGLNSGLLVQRGETIAETHGDFTLSGDKIVGAWAEIYIANMPRPLRKEVSKKEFWGTGQQWERKGGFMLCKCALDHLMRTNFPTLYSAQETEDELILEAQMPEVSTSQPSRSEPRVRTKFIPGEMYEGTIAALVPKTEQNAGRIELETEEGKLTAFFFTRPDVLKDQEDWELLIGSRGALSFTENPDKNGKVWRHVQTFDVANLEVGKNAA